MTTGGRKMSRDEYDELSGAMDRMQMVHDSAAYGGAGPMCSAVALIFCIAQFVVVAHSAILDASRIPTSSSRLDWKFSWGLFGGYLEPCSAIGCRRLS
eukprot:9482214-Pyramimonas_sp.AAC.1